MPGPRQPGQAEEKLGDEEPGSVAPFDSCTLMSMYCMKDKSDFSIFGILEAKSVDHSFSLDISRCLETPILWNEML